MVRTSARESPALSSSIELLMERHARNDPGARQVGAHREQEHPPGAAAESSASCLGQAAWTRSNSSSGPVAPWASRAHASSRAPRAPVRCPGHVGRWNRPTRTSCDRQSASDRPTHRRCRTVRSSSNQRPENRAEAIPARQSAPAYPRRVQRRLPDGTAGGTSRASCPPWVMKSMPLCGGLGPGRALQMTDHLEPVAVGLLDGNSELRWRDAGVELDEVNARCRLVPNGLRISGSVQPGTREDRPGGEDPGSQHAAARRRRSGGPPQP